MKTFMKKKEFRVRPSTIAYVMLMLALPSLFAQTADEIIEEVDLRNRVETSRMSLVMSVYPDRRNLNDIRRFELTGIGRGSEESAMTFTEPRSLNGLSLLSLGDDQWIYFPSTGRVRKVAGRSRDESVQGVGGDFSYEDLSAGDWKLKYSFSFADEDRRSWTLTGIPRKESAYSRIVVTVDKRHWMVVRVLYWKDSDKPVKELILEDIRNIDGKDTPTKTTMVNLKENSMTVIETTDAIWNLPLDDARFNPHRFWK